MYLNKTYVVLIKKQNDIILHKTKHNMSQTGPINL